MLLECQFDQNEKLKSVVNKGFEAEELRMQPIGRDLDGFIYWYHEVRLLALVLFLFAEFLRDDLYVKISFQGNNPPSQNCCKYNLY